MSCKSGDKYYPFTRYGFDLLELQELCEILEGKSVLADEIVAHIKEKVPEVVEISRPYHVESRPVTTKDAEVSR